MGCYVPAPVWRAGQAGEAAAPAVHLKICACARLFVSVQVRQNTEMESHEEKLHKMIIQARRYNALV